MKINVALILLFFFINISYLHSAEYYVDGGNPLANDANPGTKELPLKSIEAAKILVSLNKSSIDSSITVWIRKGTYYLNDTLHFREEDSGSAQYSILYQAYPGEKVVITGKKKLPYELFQSVTNSDALWNQIDQSAKGQLVFIDLNTLGISNYGTLAPPKFKISTYLQLFINDVWMPMARWPDISASANGPILNTVDAGFTKFQKGDVENSFYLPTDRMERWKDASDIMVHGFLVWLWYDTHTKVKSLDIANRKVILDKVQYYGINPKHGGQLYVYNLIEEITQPGEWFLNQSTGKLYLWPPSNFKADNIAISMLQKPIIKLENTRFLKFKNLEFNGGKKETILVSDSQAVEFDGCEFLNSGTNAVLVERSANFIIQNSTITGTGGSAVTFENCGSRPALIESDNLIQNTEISQIGKRIFAQAYAIDIIKSIGVDVINNELHDGPHSGVFFTGNENKILRNKIYNFCSKTSDAGAIYTGRDWGYRGNIIKNNFIYNIQSIFRSDVHGIYLDDAVAASSTIGNVFSNISGFCAFHRGGRDITITNNIFHKCGTAYYLQDIGIRKINNNPGHSMNFFERLRKDGIDYKKEPWASKYPRLFAIPDNWTQTSNPANKWLYPGGSIVSRNLGYQNGEFINKTGRDITQYLEEYSDNLEDVNPLFKNEAQLNFELLPNSPAFTIPGFEDIPFSTIGLFNESDVLLPHNQWKQISLPVTPTQGANTVRAIFGDELPSVSYGSTWKLFTYDSNNNQYIDVGLDEVLFRGVGYWIIQLTGSTISLDVDDYIPAQQTNFVLPLYSKKGISWNLVGNPITKAIPWHQVRVKTDKGTGPCGTTSGCTLAEAKQANIFHDQVWVYKDGEYLRLEGNDELKPWMGFWCATLPGANGIQPRLVFPAQ